MNKIISNFELNIYRLLKEYKNDKIEDKDIDFKNSLCTQVLESLYCYKEDEWLSLHESFENMELQFCYTEDTLILFYVYSLYKDKITSIDSKLLFCLISAFSNIRVDALYYKSYIDLILTHPIYNILIKFPEQELLDILNNLFIALDPAALNPFEIAKEDYEDIYNIIFLYHSISWTKEESVNSIYLKINEFIKTYGNLIFSREEQDIIANLPNILPENNDIKNKLYYLQEMYNAYPITLINEIIKLCNKPTNKLPKLKRKIKDK